MGDGKPTLLAVDDEPENLDLLERVFKEEFQVFRAASGMEALELCTRQQFAVIISDQRMPEMTGVEFLQKTIDSQPDCVRIVLKAYGDREIVVGAINRAHAYRFFSKPFEVSEMKDAVSSAVKNVHLERENKRLMGELKLRIEQLEQARVELTRYNRLLKEYNFLLEEIDRDAQ